MKVINCTREYFLDICRAAFDSMNVSPACLELGVFLGSNAQNILHKLNPSILYLLDTWSAEDFQKAYKPYDINPKWMDPPEAQFGYYQGNAYDDAHWLALYKSVVKKFADLDNVIVHRGSPGNLLEFASTVLGGGKGDFLYIDAAHQYELIFKDLMLYSELVSANGIIQLNDCCHSAYGIKQNLGVLEATIKFIKMTNWRPVAINTVDFSDLILARQDSEIYNSLNQLLYYSDINYVDVPYQLLGNSRIIINQLGASRMSFD
jgi:hypothetical protein